MAELLSKPVQNFVHWQYGRGGLMMMTRRGGGKMIVMLFVMMTRLKLDKHTDDI